MMKTKLLAILLLAGTSMFARVHLSVRVGVGPGYGYYMPPPPPPPVVRYVRPVAPGPRYTWVNGYYYPVRRHYVWHAGYWARRPYTRAYWVAPRYYRHHYYRGYWRRR